MAFPFTKLAWLSEEHCGKTVLKLTVVLVMIDVEATIVVKGVVTEVEISVVSLVIVFDALAGVEVDRKRIVEVT